MTKPYEWFKEGSVLALSKGEISVETEQLPPTTFYVVVGENAGFISAGKPSLCLYPGDKEEPAISWMTSFLLSLNGLSMFRTPEGLLLAVKP